MGFFSRKKKVTSKDFGQVLVDFAIKMSINHIQIFKEIINVNFQGKEDISSDEYKRREWEIYFFTITSFIFALEGKINIDSKNKAILDAFIEELTGNFVNIIAGAAKNALPINFINDFSAKIWQRYETYKNSWIEKGLGPVWHLSNRFLSILWHADLMDEDFLQQYQVPFHLETIMFVSKVFMSTLEFVNNSFNQIKISA